MPVGKAEDYEESRRNTKTKTSKRRKGRLEEVEKKQRAQ